MYSLDENRSILANIFSMTDILIEENQRAEISREAVIKHLHECKYSKEPIVLEVMDKKASMERCFMSFSELERYFRCIEKDKYEMKLFYYTFEEEEIIRKILALGPYVKVVSPLGIKEEIVRRIRRALELNGCEVLEEEGKRHLIQKALKEFTARYEGMLPSYPKELCFLTGTYREKYLHDMSICQEYAALNRETMARSILERLLGKKLNDFNYFHTVHNYINFKDNIIRKGSISAYEGEKVLIPINMKDGSILALGKGNADWNYSAPHGAGRLMSRSKAKEKLTLEDYKKSMEGIYTTSVNYSTLDEAPMAYKPIDEILNNIEDTVEILKIIKPIYNFKAGE